MGVKIEKINQIIIAKKANNFRIIGNLKRCPICKINFSAILPCIMCELRIKKEKELGRKLTKEEFRELMSWMG